MKKLKKISIHNVSNRDIALVYINGDIIEGKTHPDIIEDYLKSHHMINDINKQFLDSEGFSEEEKNEMLDLTEENELLDDLYYAMSEYGRFEYDLEEDLDIQLGFAHKIGDEIYIISDATCNIGFRDLVSRFKNRYPQCSIFTDEDEEKVASYNHLKRLGKHGISNRDRAILYIDGDVISGINHPRLISKWLCDHNDMEKYLKKFYKMIGKDIDSKEIQDEIKMAIHDKDLPYEAYALLMEDKRQEQAAVEHSMAFAHLVDDNIFLETKSIFNTDKDTVINAIKAAYPNYSIYDDDSHSGADSDTENYVKLAKTGINC